MTLDAMAQGRPDKARKPGDFDAEAFTRALRISGAVLVVAAASTFMLQHWDGGNDMKRYAMLLVQSVLLAGTAWFVGLTVRESRSARTLLALVLGTIPICFTVLGALLYSRFHLEALAPLPTYASWIAPSDLQALLAVPVSLLLLVPLTAIPFVALARKRALHGRALRPGLDPVLERAFAPRR